ncbi:heat shock factor 2-binding protein-like [Odontomachus brunneus]|uniref:heat shock factor 2-binding protein-like n=1 Tax=Odontomachus brunneus TaxID=486640 RepID=UPI0013F1E4F8|nr:heat shock factor 2-binding protein-like [Odontomachus brunneus]
MDHLNFANDHELFNSLEAILSSSERNLHEFISDLPNILATNNFRRGFHSEETNENKIHTFFNKFSTSSVSVSKDNAKELIALESKCEKLSAEVERLTTEKETAYEEIRHLKDQVLSQSIYCATLGAVLGNLTWRASRFPQTIDAWLSTLQSKLEEFLSIVYGTFSAFVNTYKTSLPPTSNVEYKFIIGLLGIVTNLSASPEGREFLITNSSGKEFVLEIIKLIPELPPSSGSSPLKRLILMVLYNVSMNKTGLQYLLASRVGDPLSHCLRDKSSMEETQLLCLRVLQSITYDLTEPKYIQDLTAAIPIDMIELMVSSKRSNLSNIAKQVIKHLRNCEKNCKVTSQDV